MSGKKIGSNLNIKHNPLVVKTGLISPKTVSVRLLECELGKGRGNSGDFFCLLSPRLEACSKPRLSNRRVKSRALD